MFYSHQINNYNTNNSAFYLEVLFKSPKDILQGLIKKC